jgi:hypothetical protein
MKQTLERILNQLDRAHGEGHVFLIACLEYRTQTIKSVDAVWAGGTGGSEYIPLSQAEHEAVKEIFPLNIPPFYGYDSKSSQFVTLSDIISIYKRLVLDDLINEL